MNRDKLIEAAKEYEAAYYVDHNDMRFSSDVMADFAIAMIAARDAADAEEIERLRARVGELTEALSLTRISCGFLHHPEKWLHNDLRSCPVETYVMDVLANTKPE